MSPIINHQIWQDLGDSPSESTFATIHQQTSPLVWSICRRILKNHEDASDAFQGCYARLLVLAKQEHSPPSNHSLKSLVARLAVLEADRLRKNRANRQKKESVMEGWEDHHDEQSVDAATGLLQEEVREKLVQLIEELPDHLGIAVSLHYLDGLTQQQIGEALGITQGAVNHRLKTALDKLRPKCRTAGLQDISIVLGTLAGTAALVSPPATLSAASIYASTVALSQSAGFAPPLLSSLKIIKGGLLGGKALLATTASVVVIVGIMVATAISSSSNKSANNSPGTTINTTILNGSPTNDKTLSSNSGNKSNQQTTTGSPQDQSGNDLTVQTSLNRQIQLTWLDQSGQTAGPVENATLKPLDTDLVFSSNEAGIIDLGDAITDETFKASITHPEGVFWQSEIPLSSDKLINIELEKAGTLSGLLYFEEGQRPAAGKTVRLVRTVRNKIPVEQNLYTTTDQEGRYSFIINDPSEYYIRANHEEYIDQTINGGALCLEALAGEDIDAGVLLLVEGASLSLNITTEDQEPISGASLRIDPMEINPERITDEKGNCRIEGLYPAQEYRLKIRAQGYVSRMLKLELKEKEHRNVTLALEKGGILEVAVLNEDGDSLQNAKITKHLNHNRFDLTPDKPMENGNYVVTDITKRTMNTLFFSAPGYVESGKEYIFPMTTEKDYLEIKLRKLPEVETKYFYFTGSVQTSAGDPVANATISFKHPWGNPKGQTTTNQLGEYTLKSKKSFSPQTGLFAQAEGYATIARPAPQTGSQENPVRVDFIMTPGNWMELSIYTPDGKLFPETELHLYYNCLENKLFPVQDVTTCKNQEGKYNYRFEGLPNEPVYVTISSEVFQKQTEILSVNRHHKITLKPKGIIMGQVIEKHSQSPIKGFTITTSKNEALVDLQDLESGKLIDDPEGLFTLHHFDNSDMYYITVHAEGYSPCVKRLRPTSIDETIPTVFEVEKSGDKTIVVIDKETQEPIPDVAINGMFEDSISWAGSHRFRWTVQTDVSGHAIIEKDLLSRTNDDLYLAIIPPMPYANTMVTPRGLARNNDKATIELEKGCTLNIGMTESAAQVIKGEINLNKSERNPMTGSFSEGFNVHINSETNTTIKQMATGTYNGFLYHQGRHLALKDPINIDTTGESYDLTLTNPEGEGRLYGTITLDGKPVQDTCNISINLSPLFEEAQYIYQYSIKSQGQYNIQNIPAGKYKLRFSLQTSPYQNKPLRHEATVNINGALNHPININRGHQVTVGFNENTTNGTVKSVSIIANHPLTASQDSHGTFTKQNGKWTASGKFNGEYTIRLLIFANGKEAPYTHPDPVTINNIDGDIDLGLFDLPSQMGTVNLHVTYSQGAVVDRGGTTFSLFNESNEIVASKDTTNADISFRVPSGTYTLKASGCYGLKNPAPPIVVQANDSTEYSFEVTAFHFIYAQINENTFDFLNLSGLLTPTKYVVNGPSYQKEIKPVDLNGKQPEQVFQDILKSGATEMPVEGSLILLLRDPGDYNITVYSDEYEPFTITLPATAQPNPMVIPIGDFKKKTD